MAKIFSGNNHNKKQQMNNKENNKENNEEARKIALEVMMKDVKKTYGDGSIRFLNDKSVVEVEAISTGSIDLDNKTGIGGIPTGRITEIYGHEGSGKTTLALSIIAQSKSLALFIDAEHALDPVYAERLGVDPAKLLIAQTTTAEEAFEIAATAISSGAVKVVVVDSVAALITKSELEGHVGEGALGSHARFMSQSLRRLLSRVSKLNCAVIFINQIRQKIGVMFGNPDTTTGGLALKFYSSMRLEVQKKELLKNAEGEPKGYRVQVKIPKNKCAAPFSVSNFEILYGQGINTTGEIVDIAVEKGIIAKSGSWFSYEGESIGQGRDSILRYFEDRKDILNKIKEKVSFRKLNTNKESQTE